MDAVVFEDSPLGTYLGGGEGHDRSNSSSSEGKPSLPRTPSPSHRPSYAPKGRPTVAARFRGKPITPLRLKIPQSATRFSFQNPYSRAINSQLGRIDNEKFLEQYRYTIVASQLLSGHHYPTQSSKDGPGSPGDSGLDANFKAFTVTGAVVTASIAFSLTLVVRWCNAASDWKTTLVRLLLATGLLATIAVLGQAYLRRRWLQYLRQQNIQQASTFITRSQDFDSAVTAAMNLIQEVELVSRGYRLSLPLPPISRLEDRSQTRRCMQLRRALITSLKEMMPRYDQAYATLQPLAETLSFEKYCDVYDIGDLDMQEARIGVKDGEFEDVESLRVLKIYISRFITIRKMVLCSLLALEADGGKGDYTRWRTALDEVKELSSLAATAGIRVRTVLEQEEVIPVPPTPKIPLTPGRERWRGQLRKLNTLSTGIRSLQAKLHVLREESDKTLDESEDLSDLGPHLMMQYDAIGVDLQSLMREWETGKAALASTIDRNEKRLSSMSGSFSPTTSLGGLTSVDEGTPADALKALEGEKRFSADLSISENEEVFEAIAIPRQRSTLTREERIAKMKEDRVRRESLREKTEANTNMLRELESVINLRPRRKVGPGARVTSL